MDWRQALDRVESETGVRRYRELCEDESRPERAERYRVLMVAKAGRDVQSYPPVAAMAVNAAQSLLTAARDGFRTVDAEERERRMSLCRSCEFFRPDHQACSKCGCRLSLKTRLASAHCPDNPPRW